jgi:tRNA (guanine-N7-)-methyltransferase
LHADIDDLYSSSIISDELSIKTHYEALDIAQSNRVHYLCFSLQGRLDNEEKDAELKQFLKQKHEEAI